MPSKVISGSLTPCKGDIFYSSNRDEFIIVLRPAVHPAGYFTCLSLKTQTKLVADLSMTKKMCWYIWLRNWEDHDQV